MAGNNDGGRDTLPSTITDEDDGSTTPPDGTTNGGTEVLDPAGFDDYAIDAAPSPEIPGVWEFGVRPPGDSSSSLRFEWDFGDGQIYIGATQQHLFRASGTQTVTVRGFDSRNRLVLVLSLDVEIPPPSLPPTAHHAAIPLGTDGLRPGRRPQRR
ncbi:MAG: PKD domain-containing protein [Planctomycetes bacterium]|nr:PKD domain-containing protein [Planctomycetota bacterium]